MVSYFWSCDSKPAFPRSDWQCEVNREKIAREAQIISPSFFLPKIRDKVSPAAQASFPHTGLAVV
ncbi:hypothetical protein BGLA2_610051 [Burkholderia gladioli]|nr:hypothetical protein BGLA2_610051 [Burkholderia gladioli]